MLIIQICAAVTVGLFEPWLLTSKTRYTVYIYIYIQFVTFTPQIKGAAWATFCMWTQLARATYKM